MVAVGRRNLVETGGYRVRTDCRICGGRLERLWDLGLHPLPDFTSRTAEEALAVPVAPLVLAECSACGLVQLEGTVERGLLFNEKYPYRSGVNATMRAHLAGIARQALSLVPNGKHAVLDVGSNDGTLLLSFPDDWVRVGYDPSFSDGHGQNLTLVHAPFAVRNVPSSFRPRIITSAAVFYDLDNPQEFVNDIAKVLAPDGIWINEFNYLPSMLENHAYDMIGHEHLVYYRLQDITTLCAVAGLEVVHAETNSINGGSLRVVVKHKGIGEQDETVGLLLLQEDLTYNADFLPDWTDECRERVQTLRDYLAGVTNEWPSLWLYGASTRGLTTLHLLYENGFPFASAAERNPDKWGCYIPGTGIPITSEDDFHTANPRYALVLPHAFFQEFQEREIDWLQHGGQFIIPIPELRIIRG